MHTVFLFDRIQKGVPVDKEDVDRLRALKLVEGRMTSNLYHEIKVEKHIADEINR